MRQILFATSKTHQLQNPNISSSGSAWIDRMWPFFLLVVCRCQFGKKRLHSVEFHTCRMLVGPTSNCTKRHWSPVAMARDGKMLCGFCRSSVERKRLGKMKEVAIICAYLKIALTLMLNISFKSRISHFLLPISDFRWVHLCSDHIFTIVHHTQEVQQRGFEPPVDFFNSAMAACAAAQRWGDLHGVFEQLQTWDAADAESYRLAMEACNELQCQNQVVELLRTAEEWPGIQNLRIFLVSCKQGQSQKSLRRGILPTPVMFNLALKACPLAFWNSDVWICWCWLCLSIADFTDQLGAWQIWEGGAKQNWAAALEILGSMRQRGEMPEAWPLDSYWPAVWRGFVQNDL